MKRFTVLLFMLTSFTLARGDIGPPVGKKSVPVTTTVEATEDFPDYAFFETAYSSTPGPPPHGGNSSSVTLHFFVPGATIKRTGDRRSGGGLYAIPRTEAEKVAGWKGYAADAAKNYPQKHGTIPLPDTQLWFALGRSVSNREVPGAVSIRFGGSENLPINDERTAIAETYRIVRTPAGVAFVKPGEEAPAPRAVEGDPILDGRPFPWKWAVAGGAVFAAILLTGLWLVMRGKRA